MIPVFVNSAVCISPQETLKEDFFETLSPITDQILINAIPPEYKNYISPGMIRRMSKSVKMSSVASHMALEEAKITNPDAIIVGTGMGCEEDSEKFLKMVILDNEEYLTPTHFIQSTHNTVAGQIALARECHGYNFTYVNSGSSLEMSLLDAKLQLENKDADRILVGATDEKSLQTMKLYQLNHTIKREDELPVNHLHSTTPGVVWGEGSSFFVLGNQKQETAVAELAALTFINHLEKGEVSKFIEDFLKKNNLTVDEIDAVLLGYSGDSESDLYYKEAQENFGTFSQLYFKHLCGEFNTASGFAFYMATQILKKQEIPTVMKINAVEKSEIKHILIYNHLFGVDHSLILLRKI